MAESLDRRYAVWVHDRQPIELILLGDGQTPADTPFLTVVTLLRREGQQPIVLLHLPFGDDVDMVCDMICSYAIKFEQPIPFVRSVKGHWEVAVLGSENQLRLWMKMGSPGDSGPHGATVELTSENTDGERRGR